MKKRLTSAQEFDIMKLVLDKFLWLGIIIMAYGLYQLVEVGSTTAFYVIATGLIVLILFMILLVKEYEIVK